MHGFPHAHCQLTALLSWQASECGMRSGRAGYSPPVTKQAVVGTSQGGCKWPSVTPSPGWATRLSDAEPHERPANVHREALAQLNNFSFDVSKTTMPHLTDDSIGGALHGADTSACRHDEDLLSLLGEPVLPDELMAACSGYVRDAELELIDDIMIDNFWSNAFPEHLEGALPQPPKPFLSRS